MTVDIAPGPLTVPYTRALDRLEQAGFAEALWQKRLDVWTSDAATQQKIATRLGWLDAIEFVTPHLPRLRALAADVKAAGFTDILLLGMGGSSLAPEVLRQVIGVAAGHPRFRVLDSVDPDAVRAAMAQAPSTLFILASKSGSTIEPNVMAAEASRRVQLAGHAWGSRVIAITDPDTQLHQRAAAEGFRDVFVNPPDIGGRFSALSFFGLVPAALMGADLDALLQSARAMDAACRAPVAGDNPGAALGALMAAGALTGRDKMTLLFPERLQPLGLWVEQLVAESTGKQGKGVVPVAGEGPDAPLGADRIIVAVSLDDEAPDPSVLARAREAGVPIATLRMNGVAALGGEFLRWEIATAAAGFLLSINPFDEPNVAQAKDATRALLDVYKAQGSLPTPEPAAAIQGVRLALSAAAEDQLSGAGAEAFLRLVKPGDYLALLAYVPSDEAAWAGVLHQLRGDAGVAAACSTMFGFGPRYLHSTGQLHKGGADNGVFIVITAEPADDLAIPGEPFSFGILEMAQALGDFQSLGKAGRRALHIHLPRRDPSLLTAIGALLIEGRAQS